MIRDLMENESGVVELEKTVLCRTNKSVKGATDKKQEVVQDTTLF